MGGMDEQVENTDKLATGLQHLVTGATAYSALVIIIVFTTNSGTKAAVLP